MEGLMSLQNAESETVPQKSNGWLRRASKAFARLARSAPPTPARAEPTPAAKQLIIGVRKSAICKDARGQLRTIDLFLPAELVRELSPPLDIRVPRRRRTGDRRSARQGHQIEFRQGWQWVSLIQAGRSGARVSSPACP
jgi:hypothetical protein